MSIDYPYLKNNAFEYLHDIGPNNLILHNEGEDYEIIFGKERGVQKVYRSGGWVGIISQEKYMQEITGKNNSCTIPLRRSMLCIGSLRFINKDMVKPITITMTISSNDVSTTFTRTFTIVAKPCETINFTQHLNYETDQYAISNIDFTSDDGDFDVSGNLIIRTSSVL